jgi:membrane-associated protease RseP (regulator of RpoE activity)
MNVGRIKLACWVGVLGLCGYLAWDVYHFITVVTPENQAQISEETQLEYLKVPLPPEEARGGVPYTSVKRSYTDLNWSGSPPVPEHVPETPLPTVVVQTPMAELLTVLMIQYDGEDADQSLAPVTLRYGANENLVLRKDDRLPGKHQYARVSMIQPGFVEFSFDAQEGQEPRQPERVPPPPFKGEGRGFGIVKISDSGVPIEPPRDSLITMSADRNRFNYETTTEVRTNQFQVGYKDAATFNENWSNILSGEVRTRQHRDPRTGRYAGIQVTDIAPGSIVSRHGLQAGDIVKSINGDPVTSTQEAISYVKTNAETTRNWEVVVERQGRDVTLTYTYDPPSN